jgi:hypothetical protein
MGLWDCFIIPQWQLRQHPLHPFNYPKGIATLGD